MQNSAVMAIRATVLLVCFVAVPVIAIWGKNAPDVVKSLIHDYAGTPAKIASTTASSTDAPVFRPGLIGGAPPSQETAAARSGEPAMERPASLERLKALNGGMPPNPIPALNAGLAPNGQTGVRAGTLGVPPQDSAVAVISHQVEDSTGFGKNVDRQPISKPPISNPRPDVSTPTRFPADHFRIAETRLRRLGATYYLLETLGPAGDQYRFVCKVAGGSQPEEMLAFFAVDTDPLAAMENVARQVEGWRAHLTP